MTAACVRTRCCDDTALHLCLQGSEIWGAERSRHAGQPQPPLLIAQPRQQCRQLDRSGAKGAAVDCDPHTQRLSGDWHRTALPPPTALQRRAVVKSGTPDSMQPHPQQRQPLPSQRSWLYRAAFAALSWPGCCVLGLAVRLLLIWLGALADSSAHGVRYSDVDYAVYSDAAARTAAGGSPYDRATYRYTPLLAWAMLPTAWGMPLFGKLLFSLIDVAMAALARALLMQRGVALEAATRRAAWPLLFNPLVINLSTRGNADALIVALVLASLWALQEGLRWIRTAAVMYGLAVHVKIYPIVYAPAIWLFLNEHYPAAASSSSAASPGSSSNGGVGSASIASHPPPSSLWRDMFSPLGLKLRFVLWSVSTLVLLTLLGHALYGWPFLHETYLYHVVRVDTRRHFSVYFLQLYLESSEKMAAAAATAAAASVVSSGDALLPLLSFLPQVVVLLVLSLSLYRDLPLCLFAQSLAFVAWNKVVTAQYFLWWIVPAILVAPQSKMGWRGALALGSVWMAAELHWLYWGYRVEFLGLSSFLGMWVAGLVFFGANMAVLAGVLANHRFVPVFLGGRRTSVAEGALAHVASASAAATTLNAHQSKRTKDL